MKTMKKMMVVLSTICLMNTAKAVTPFLATVSATSPWYYTGVFETGEILHNSITPADWELCYSSDMIYIYERWINVTQDHSIIERKGEMYVNCSLEDAIKTLSDYEHMKNWMGEIKENKLMKKSSSSNWTLYTLFELPWPFQNRDVVSEYNVVVVNPGSYVEIRIKSVDNLLGQKDGIYRITKYNATWTVKRITDKKCSICFSVTNDNPPVVPRSIQNPIIRKTFHKNLLRLRNTLE